MVFFNASAPLTEQPLSLKIRFMAAYQRWIDAKRKDDWKWHEIELAWAEYCVARDLYCGFDSYAYAMGAA